MSARNDTHALMAQFAHRDIYLTFDEANTLRRAQLTLHRWGELECGDGNEYSSWAIERDEETGKPYFCRYHHHVYEHVVTSPEGVRTFFSYASAKAYADTVPSAKLNASPNMSRHRIPDREAGALKRIAAICKEHGLHFYHQTDPRGCALYVDREPLPDHNYSRGVACCA